MSGGDAGAPAEEGEGARSANLPLAILNSLFWAAASSGGNQLIRFVVFVALTRRVTAAEFGLVALSSVIVDLLSTISVNGLVTAVIRKPELQDLDADTAFWTALTLGGATFCTALALAPWAAVLLHASALTPVFRALSLTLVIAPLGAIHTARLERNLRFKTLAVRSLVSSVVGGAAGLILSFSGPPLWGLVVRALVSTLVSALMVWPATRWRPRLRFEAEACVSLLRFAARITGAQLVGVLNGRAVELAAGLLINPAAAGVLRMSARCLRLLTQVTLGPLSQVALPALSTARGDPEALQRAYKQLSRVTGIVVFPAFLGLMAVSDLAFRLVFGPHWELTGIIAPVLCLVILPSLFNLLMNSALLASGCANTMLRWNIVQAVVGIPLSFAGAAAGLVPLVAASVARGYVPIPLGVRWLKRDVGISARATLEGLGRPLAAASLMAGVVFLAKIALRPLLPQPVLLALLVGLGGLIYAGLVLLLAPDIASDLKQVLAARRRKRGRLSEAAAERGSASRS